MATNYSTQSAPGYGNAPVCWKCRGRGKLTIGKGKRKRKRTDDACTVCKGSGRLMPKRKEAKGVATPGKIKEGRVRPKDWVERGPKPFQSLEELSQSLCPGEEACLISGMFRLIQRAGSHRYSTDDLACAVRAIELFKERNPHRAGHVRYCDLGCGIGSVLQTVLWCFATYLEKETKVTAVGLEAQEISAKMARRSLSFNLGPEETEGAAALSGPSLSWRVFEGDLRDERNITKLLTHHSFGQKNGLQYDLVTGTPPYFEVAWTKQDEGGGGDDGMGDNAGAAAAAAASHVAGSNAIPLQGGMPSCAQSAPARNEFRGGIEVYCKAAASLLSPTGLFVVANASINTLRTEKAAAAARLRIESRLDVCGRVGKRPLFSVWAMSLDGGHALPTSNADASVTANAAATSRAEGEGEGAEAGAGAGEGVGGGSAAAVAAKGGEVEIVHVRQGAEGAFKWTPEWCNYMEQLGVPPR